MKNRLSFDDFKKWMDQQETFSPFEKPIKNKEHVGTLIESKISRRKLIEKIMPEEGEKEDLALDFIQEGGKVTDMDGKYFLVEVASGTFYIARHYTRKS